MKANAKYHGIILLLVIFSVNCASSSSKSNKKALPVVSSSQGFYMVFRNLPDSSSRADFIGQYPVLARQCFYKHILQMVQDRSFKQASPLAYDKAWKAGEKLGKLYSIKQNDATLQEIFDRIEPLP